MIKLRHQWITFFSSQKDWPLQF